MAALSPDQLCDAIGAEVARYPDVAAAWLFGSLARGEARDDSDLDLAILLREGARSTLTSLYELAAELERYSPSGKVDVVLLGPQGPVFRHRVLREGRLVHDADPERRVAFEGHTIAEYLDWKPTHDIAMNVVFTGLRERFARGRP